MRAPSGRVAERQSGCSRLSADRPRPQTLRPQVRGSLFAWGGGAHRPRVRALAGPGAAARAPAPDVKEQLGLVGADGQAPAVGGPVDRVERLWHRPRRIERMFGRTCTFKGCDKPLLAKGYCSAHYRQSRKGKPLRPIRPFSGKTGPYGPGGPCRFNELPQVRSGEWEPCLAARATGGWCAGHAAQWYEKRPLKPLRRRRTGCDFPGCSNRHSCRGYCAAHYQQLRQGKTLTLLNLRKGWYRASNDISTSGNLNIPTPTNEGTSQNIQRSWLQCLNGPSCPRRKCTTGTRQRDDNRPENLELWARGRQPPGARVSDLVEEAIRILLLYAPDRLSKPS
jgi:hypothetical protein